MKKQINFYQPSCYPERNNATFKQFLMLLAGCFFSVIFLYFILNQKFISEQQVAKQQQALLVKKQSELSVLVTQLQNNKTVPEEKVRQQLLLKKEVVDKKQLLASFAGVEANFLVKFSELMRGLSLANMKSISVNDFSIIGGRVSISGQARLSDSVPLWLGKIQTTKELSGIAFEKFEISAADDGNGFIFQLSNALKEAPIEVSGQ